MKKIVIFILTISLLLSSLTIPADTYKSNGEYGITPRSDAPNIDTNNN